MQEHVIAEEQRKRRRFGRYAALVSVLVVSLTLAACGGDDDDSSGDATAASSSSTSTSGGVAKAAAALKQWEKTPTSIGLTEPLNGKPAPGKHVAFLGTNDPNNVKIQKRIKELAALVGWKYSLVGYDPAKPDTFQRAITTALSKKPNYLVEAGIPLTPNHIKQVKDAGAKWVLNAVAPAEVKDPVIVDTNSPAHNAVMGKMMADFFIADSKGKGVAIMEHIPSYPILGAFAESFQKEVDANCPDCKVTRVDITLPQLAAGKVPSLMVSALRKNPKANYLVFDVGPFATGITAALRAAGLQDKVKIIGEAADEGAIAGLKNGTQTAWSGFESSYSALQSMDAMLRDAEGSPVNADKLATQPTQLLTKDNIHDVVGNATTWSAPTDALEQFKKLWHLS